MSDKERPLTGPTHPLYRQYHNFLVDLLTRLGFDIPNVNQSSIWPVDPLKSFLKRFILPKDLVNNHLDETSPLLHVFMTIALMMVFCAGIVWVLLFPNSWHLGFALSSLSVLHLLEYILLALHQHDKNNIKYANFAVFIKPMISYHAVVLEYLFWSFLSYLFNWSHTTKTDSSQPYWPPTPSTKYISYIGVIFTLVGQFLRSLAMYQCGFNFQYTLREKKEEQNHLVTTGIFSAMRHPSYVGMIFYLAGLALTLQTPIILISPVVFIPLVFARIEREEETLVGLYGDEYLQYRATTPALIPNENIFKLSTYMNP